MEYENPWQYKGKAIEQDDLDGHLAFVYCITNIKTKKAYIGKKLLQKVKTRQVKGKKKIFRKPRNFNLLCLLYTFNEIGCQIFRLLVHLRIESQTQLRIH
jgi:uncharacterized membrane protein YbhN (UPF0104 family)